MATLAVAILARWTEADLASLTIPTDDLAAERDRRIAARRRAIAEETTDLLEISRRQAVLRWRGLAPDGCIQ